MTGWPAPPLPKPVALRLARASPAAPARAARVTPPCGLSKWSEADDADVALLLGRPHPPATPTLAEITAQILAQADPSSLRPGTLVVVLGELEPMGALLGRLLRRKVRAARALRSSALLALGYERLGGGVDPRTGDDLAWGYVRSRRPRGP
jgi:hypothetical protein